MTIRRFRFISIMAAVIVFGAWSQPTPENISIAEVVMAFFLVLSVSLRTLVNNLLVPSFTNPPFLIIFLLLVFPLLTSMLYQHPTNQVFRDFIAMGFVLIAFMGLPILNVNEIKIFEYTLFAAGALFAGREFAGIAMSLEDLGKRNFVDDQMYLLQDACVLFAALFAIRKTLENLSNNNLFQFCLFSTSILLFQIAFLSQALRANILISGFYTLLLIRQESKLLFKILYFLLLAACTFFIMNNSQYFMFFIQKFQSVGDNGKVKEFISVFEYIGSDIMLSVFGAGHGGEFYSPTYGSKMNFTHSLFTYLVLKNGLIIGLGVSLIVYTYWIKTSINYIFDKTRVTLLLYPLSFAPALLTQPTYKSLGFGILVWLFLCVRKRGGRVA